MAPTGITIMVGGAGGVHPIMGRTIMKADIIIMVGRTTEGDIILPGVVTGTTGKLYRYLRLF